MSDRYPFTGDRNFTQSGTMVWNDQVAVQASLDFSNVSDTTLTDSINDSYVTAVGDNETQYLSVLETTNDITLEDLHNITLENSKIAMQENMEFDNVHPEKVTVANDTSEQQVIVFNVDGSDDLYGIQLVQDDEGNIQKYQFKFRTTEDGQLEAIPESIELLANDIEMQQTVEENEVLVQETINNEEAEVAETQVIYQEQVLEDEDQEEFTLDVAQESCAEVQTVKGEPITEYEDDGSVHPQMYEEELLRDDVVEQAQYAENETEVNLEHTYEEDPIDIKTGIIEESPGSANIKQEVFQDDSQDVNTSEAPEEYEIFEHRDIKPIPYNMRISEENQDLEQDVSHHIEGNIEVENAYSVVNETQETVLEYEDYPSKEIHNVYEETDTTGTETYQDIQDPDFNHVYIKDNMMTKVSGLNRGQALQSIEEAQETFYTETGIENDSDNEDYQIVEGLHVTAEGDIDEETCQPYHESDTILQEVMRKSPVVDRANILKQTSHSKTFKETKVRNNKTLFYYVVPHVEKENVNSLPVNYTTGTNCRAVRSNPNPRSILKSSFPEIKQDPRVITVNDERFNKRFARSKEAVQARLFNNFISKTTILHAPVRQTRLPRKQQIKPVDNRRDEEIIVQEVMVGSNGFIENVEEKAKNKDKLEVTQYVVLSDSDEDYDPKKGNTKKKKYKKIKKGAMDSADDSDTSVIEIQSDDNDAKSDQIDSPRRGRGRPVKKSVTPDANNSIKRRRGRPPKSAPHSDVEESPQKKSRTESEEIDSDTAKKEFKCPHCTKTFPSSNSLSTHIQHHNLENSLRNSQANKTNIKNTALEYKHKCETCKMTFKNSILLKRHVCAKQSQKTNKRLDCSVCKKSFPDMSALNVHKRVHVKENLVNNTTLVKVSPKKILPRYSSISRLKSPAKKSITKTNFKCKQCSRLCFSQESLNLHEKTHKKFLCSSCGSMFPSRLLLDTHVRVNCVKQSPQANKRLSFKIRKSFVHSPSRKLNRTVRRSVNRASPNLDTTTKIVTNNSLHLNLECEHCDQKFTLFQDYFKHQVKMHGLETPDKSIMTQQRKQLHKPKTLHGGIPCRDGMRKIFADIRSKMVLLTPKKDGE